MELIVRAVDVGSGNTKFVTAAAGIDIRCTSFPSVAYPSSDDSPSWPASERKKTVCIPIGPLFYEVGPDVSLAADTFRAKQLHDEYTETPEYMALLRGALSMMKLSRIDLLVVGLPVALFAVKKVALEKAMTGRHDLGGGKAVTVGKALAVPQPQGALVHYASEHQKMAIIGNEQSLIIDPGSRTFDWLVARGMRFVQKQSYSFNRGMSDVLRLLAAEITKDIGSPYRDYDAIDLALRTGKHVMVKAPTRRALPIPHLVKLMTDEQVVALVRRREEVLAGRALPCWPLSRKACPTCAFRTQCDYPHL